MGKQRQRRFCGHCAQCLVKTDCGKCKFCVNKKRLKKKCELRRCQAYEKVQTTDNASYCDAKWTFTLQLSNKLIEACYNQEYGTQKSIAGTIYEGATVYKDQEKIIIDLEDSSNIVYTKTTAGKPHHHSVVDITFSNDASSNRKPNQSKSKQEETTNDLSHSCLSDNTQVNAKIEDNDSYHEDVLDEPMETILVNFTSDSNEKTKHVAVKLEQCESFSNENYDDNTSDKEHQHTSDKEDQHVLRQKRRSYTPVIYREDSGDTVEYESSNESFHSSKSKKSTDKLYQTVNIKCEPETTDKKELNELPEANNENDDTDEYTLSSEDEFESDNDHSKGVKRSIKSEHKRTCNRGQNVYLVKIKCPVCSKMYKYSRNGIIRHIKDNHRKEDNQLDLTEKLKQNMVNLSEVKDEMICEFCKKKLCKFSYPLHIQLEHAEQNYEKSQEYFAKYFTSVMSVDEWMSKHTAIEDFHIIITMDSLDSVRDNSMYLINIECPVCDIIINYNEQKLCEHFNESHSELDNKLELITKLKQNMRYFANSNSENNGVSCEFCEKVYRKAFLPLHIQWEHSDRSFERSQIILATYFKTVMSVDELQHESIIKDSELSVTVQENSTKDIETSSCKDCGKIVGQTKMAKHHKICEKNRQKVLHYYCKCGFKSLDISLSNEHKSICNKGNVSYKVRVECPVCGCLYKYSRESIIRHIKDHHKDIPNQLDLIKKLAQNIVDWENTDGDTLTCEICDTIWSKAYYPIHIQWKHSDRNVDWCRSLLSNYFENVMSVNEFSSIEMYKNSQVSVNVMVEKCVKDMDATTCENCGKVIDKKKLARHLNVCLLNSDVSLSSAEQGGKRKGACEHCGKIFERKKLSRHRSKCNNNPNRKIFYRCECGFRSLDMAVIKEHRSSCIRDPVICDICGKKLKSKSHYFKHRKFDHGIVSARGTAIKDYPCEDCDRVFNLPSKLRVHRIRNHSDEKNFICEFCSCAYKFPTALKNHIRFAHNNIHRYYCEKCGHGMNKKAIVKTHVCGRTRRRLKLHEKWMKNLDEDRFKQSKPTKAKTVKVDKSKANVINQQNEGKEYAIDPGLQESSAQYFNTSSELQPNYRSPSSVDVTSHKYDNIDITPQQNVRQSVHPTESMIFPMQNSYMSLQPLSGYQYPPFINSNETLPSSSGYNMGNYHMR